MRTQVLFSVQVMQSFSPKCKCCFLQCCPKKLILLLCECIVNMLKENLRSLKRHHMAKFENDVRQVSLKRTTWNQRRDILASEKSLQLFKFITLLVNNHLIWYGAVCPLSSLCVQREFDYPVSYKAETSIVSTFENPTYQIDSLKKLINKNLTAKTDSLVDKILCYPCNELWNLQALILDGVDTEILLLDFVQQLRRKIAVIPDNYVFLLDAACMPPTLVLNQNAKTKKRGNQVSIKIWTWKLQNMYTQGGAAHGSVRIFVKTSNLPVSEVKHFL